MNKMSNNISDNPNVSLSALFLMELLLVTVLPTNFPHLTRRAREKEAKVMDFSFFD